MKIVAAVGGRRCQDGGSGAETLSNLQISDGEGLGRRCGRLGWHLERERLASTMDGGGKGRQPL